MGKITVPDLTETSYLIFPNDIGESKKDLLLDSVGSMIAQLSELPGSSHRLEEVNLGSLHGGEPLFVSEVLRLDLRGTEDILAGIGKRLTMASSIEEHFARKVPFAA